MTLRIVATLAALCLAGAAGAQDVQLEVRSDLDGNGRAETFRLVYGEESADLVIEGGPNGRVTARDIAWKGGIGQEPELAVLENGSVQVISRNESIGRNRWSLALTVAWRGGAYRVAGVTYTERDTLDVDMFLTCDLNLLSGKGISEDASGRHEVRTELKAMPVTQWSQDEMMPPAACAAG